MTGDLKALIEAADVVSFDVFDTLFVRPLFDPEDLFDMVGEQIGLADFRQRRQSAQALAFRRMHEAGRKEINLDDIYDCFDPPAVRQQAKHAEFRMELALTLPNPRLAKIFCEAVETRRTVITSDMYLPGVFFEELFARHNLPRVPFFISSERNATKRDYGELFDLVVQEMEVAPECILHIGDNPVSDVQQARSRGLVAFHYQEARAASPIGSYLPSTSLAGSLHRVVDSPPVGSFEGLGFNVAGPAAVGFLDWISRQASIDDIDIVLFVSRDGFILDRLARATGAPPLPPHAYFKGSRVAFTMAYANEHNFQDRVDFLLAGSEGLQPVELLERIGVSPPAEHVMADLGLGDDVVIGAGNMAQMRYFLTAFKWEILKVARQTRRGLFRYLLEIGVTSGMRVALVDVGWNGTGQETFEMAIHTLLDVEVFGYYFCLADTVESRRRQSKLNMRGMFARGAITDAQLSALYASRVAVELLFSAPHHAVIGYKEGSDSVVAVEDAGRNDPGSQIGVAEAIVSGLDIFAERFRGLCADADYVPDPMGTAAPVFDFITQMTGPNRQLLSEVQNFDTWSSSRNMSVQLSSYLDRSNEMPKSGGD